MCQISLTLSIWWCGLVLHQPLIKSSRNVLIFYVDIYKNEEQFFKNKIFGGPQTEKSTTAFFPPSMKVTFKKKKSVEKKKIDD